MIGSLLPLTVGIPLLAAGLTAMLATRRSLSTVILLATLVLNLGAAALLTAESFDGTVHAHQVGGWIPGVSIPFVVDGFSAPMMVVAGLLVLVCVSFAITAGTGRNRLFAPLILVLLAGVNGALFTADLFNLFVFIEVMLLPSYGLLIISRPGEGTLRAVIGSRMYVTFNLFVSTLFLAGVGLVYGTAGTVNMAELAGAAGQNSTTAAAAATCIAALCMKAAVVPVHGWLALTYPSTSPAITALFSGLHTKVAIYGVYRLYAVLFAGAEQYLWIGVALFSATMLVGVLGAVGEGRMRSILAFHMVSQIGYILLGVALFTQAGLTAGIFYLLHHMIVKASLFLSAGAIETRAGTDRLEDLRGRIGAEPLLAAAFAIAALSLAGLPPFSGFFAKLTLIVASVEKGEVYAVVIALVVSLITLLSMLKIFNVVFSPTVTRTQPTLPLSVDDGPPPAVVGAPQSGASSERGVGTAVAEKEITYERTPLRLALPGAALACVTLALGLGAEGLLAIAETAAAGLLDTTAYVEALLP
ncbi:MAG: monovalent cation/H+ antiporter subunit D family protein [bacterium]|nr:monovalent cation/H+ antiporter subunit D family protein [bacterium]